MLPQSLQPCSVRYRLSASVCLCSFPRFLQDFRPRFEATRAPCQLHSVHSCRCEAISPAVPHCLVPLLLWRASFLSAFHQHTSLSVAYMLCFAISSLVFLLMATSHPFLRPVSAFALLLSLSPSVHFNAALRMPSGKAGRDAKI